jgi:hypothetical protein
LNKDKQRLPTVPQTPPELKKPLLSSVERFQQAFESPFTFKPGLA